MTLVDPGVPNGTPAMITIRWPAGRDAVAQRHSLGLGDHLLELGNVAGPHRMGAPEQAEPPGGLERRREHEQRHRGPLAGHPPGGRARRW